MPPSTWHRFPRSKPICRKLLLQRPDLEHLWFSGGDPLTLSMDRLETLISLTHRYLPKASISMYGRVDSTFRKTVADLKHLKELGVDDIVIGIESGYDLALKAMNKGYTAADLLRECRKFEEAGQIDDLSCHLSGRHCRA